MYSPLADGCAREGGAFPEKQSGQQSVSGRTAFIYIFRRRPTEQLSLFLAGVNITRSKLLYGIQIRKTDR